MNRGLYVAASGMMAEMHRQDAIANNLANATTAGYKADRTSQRDFAEVLMSNRATGETIGRGSLGVIAQNVTLFEQGAITSTEQPLDMALSGPGFFAVQTEQGVRYTRAGRFTVNADGMLSDPQGRPVLTETGATVNVGNRAADVRVEADGRLLIGDRAAGRLQVVQLDDPRKAGDNLVTGQVSGGIGETQVLGRRLESSTTDATRSVVDLIASTRAFEAGQRVLRSIDETLAKTAQLASVNGG
jgi:flagellar basal-body rod protein FlgG